MQMIVLLCLAPDHFMTSYARFQILQLRAIKRKHYHFPLLILPQAQAGNRMIKI
jgi:hypothetical protein